MVYEIQTIIRLMIETWMIVLWMIVSYPLFPAEIITRIFIGPRCPWGPIFGSGCPSVRHRRFADLTDVTLADEDTKPIITDNANRAIQGNVATKVMQLGGNFANDAGGAT